MSATVMGRILVAKIIKLNGMKTPYYLQFLRAVMNHEGIEKATASSQNETLDKFVQDVKQAAYDLEWVREATGHNIGETLRNQELKGSGDSVGGILADAFNVARFYGYDDASELSDNIENGDAWYNSFRSRECDGRDCASTVLLTSNKNRKKKKYTANKATSSLSETKTNPIAQQLRPANLVPIFSKPSNRKLAELIYKQYKNDRANSEDANPDFDNDKQMSPLHRNFQPSSKDGNDENSELSDDVDEEPVPNESNDPQPSKNHIELKDQLEQTKNDLSHEADYKLSKIEQESMGKRANITWPLQHPDYAVSLRMHNFEKASPQHQEQLSEEAPQHPKRDAMEVINLKISNGLLSRGLGASLPSDALEAKHKITVQEILNEGEAEKPEQQSDTNSREWRRDLSYVGGRRRLLQIDDDSTGCEELNTFGNSLKESSLKNQPHLRRRRSVAINTPHLIAAQSEKIEQNDNDPYPSAEDFDSEFRFEKSPKLSKNVNEKSSSKSAGSSSETPDSPTAPSNSSAIAQPDSGIRTSSEASISGNGSSREPSKPKETIKIRIGLTTNAIDNGSFSKQFTVDLSNPKPIVLSTEKLTEEVKSLEKRDIAFPHIPILSKRRANEDVRDSLMKTYQDSPLDDLVSGKLPSKMIEAVFMFAKNNAVFRSQIWPALKNRKPTSAAELGDFSAIRNENNAAQIQHTEQMLREVVETLNSIIEQQVRSRTCIPLRPDLQEFYNQIIESKAENEKQIRSSRKRKVREHHGGHISKRETSDGSRSEIEQKNSVIKRLLNQYDTLSPDDQDKAKQIKDLLEVHLVYLQELDDKDRDNDRKRRKRTVRDERIKRNDNGLSEKFLKLTRTAELMRLNPINTEDTGDYDSMMSD